MPLPTGGPWPPKELSPVTSRLAVWSAWYSGDTDMLSDIYGGQLAGDPGVPLTGFLNPDRPGLRGVIGRTLARWFWGLPTPRGENRTKLHLPVAGDIATVSADMLFSEPPTFTMPDEKDTATQDRLNELADDGLHAALLEAAEVSAGLGGVYLKVCWDKAIDDKRPWISSVHADAAVPEFRYGRLVAVTFWRSIYEDGGQVVRHLERHEPGAILHGLYDGGRGDLGRPISLDSYPETKGLLPVVETQIKLLTADYVPNIRPARVWRNQPAGAYLGRADFSGTEGFMDALDEVYSSWMRDIRHAKARLIVGEGALQNLGKGSGSRFDVDREVYEEIALAPNSAAPAITNVQFSIRVAEHMQSAQHWMDKIIQTSGYSTQTFGEQGNDGAAAMTATEIRARQQRSYITRDKKIMYMRPPLARITEAQLAIDRVVFGSQITPDKPRIQFGDTVSEDPLTLAQTAQALRAAEAASDETIVQLVNPEWDEEQVTAEVAKIQEQRQQSSMIVPGPGDGMGSTGPGAQLDEMQQDPATYGGQA